MKRALVETGLPFAVVRPTVVFGPGDVLVNNIAWFLRRLPVFAIAGSGDYRVRPIHVDDVARLCVESGARTDDVVDPVGPETVTFEEMVELVRWAVDSRSLLVHVPSPVVPVLAGVLGLLTRDVVLTAARARGTHDRARHLARALHGRDPVSASGSMPTAPRSVPSMPTNSSVTSRTERRGGTPLA